MLVLTQLIWTLNYFDHSIFVDDFDVKIEFQR